MSEKTNILLVDDDKFLLDMYSMKFVQQGFNVEAYLSANDALDALRHGYKADAIVFDLVMPERDGFSFLQVLREEHLGEGAKKIALTNQSTDAERAKALELGADDFMVKATMVPSEIVSTVAAALGQKK